MLILVRFYRRWLSRYTPSCPYTPSCSRYAEKALERHGALRGTSLALGRLARCRPGTEGGHDPVPL